MNGERAESNALAHSSCGRCPHPDMVTSLCTGRKNPGYSDQQSGKIELEFMTEYTMGKLRAIEVHKMKS